MPVDDATKRILDYKKEIKQSAETLVNENFPERSLLLDSLLNSEEFKHYPDESAERIYSVEDCGDKTSVKDNDLLNTHRTPRGTCAFGFESGLVPTNPRIKNMIEKVKPILNQLMLDSQKVRLWLQFSIPKIEDGNNFGVNVQENALAQTAQIEKDTVSYFNLLNVYFEYRGNLIAKIAKYPSTEDFRNAIMDMDFKQTTTIRYILEEMRNHYTNLHDLILKNIEKIKVPRSSSPSQMY